MLNDRDEVMELERQELFLVHVFWPISLFAATFPWWENLQIKIIQLINLNEVLNKFKLIFQLNFS
jgi:hypothetical protein